jgi:hypothetical protein
MVCRDCGFPRKRKWCEEYGLPSPDMPFCIVTSEKIEIAETKQMKRHIILEVSADYPESQFSLENEVIDIKDELENFTLLANVEVKIKSVVEASQ